MKGTSYSRDSASSATKELRCAGERGAEVSKLLGNIRWESRLALGSKDPTLPRTGTTCKFSARGRHPLPGCQELSPWRRTKGPGQFDDRLSYFEDVHHNYALQKSRFHESFQVLQVWLTVEGFLPEMHPVCV